MDLERQRKEKEIGLINRIRPVFESDPNYEKPLSSINVEFEIVEPIKN